MNHRFRDLGRLVKSHPAQKKSLQTQRRSPTHIGAEDFTLEEAMV